MILTMWKICTICFITLTFVSAIYSSEKPQIITRYIKSVEGESLEDLIKRHYKVDNQILLTQGYLAKIKRWNPLIVDVDSLPANQVIYIELPWGIANANPPLAENVVAEVMHVDEKRKWGMKAFYFVNYKSIEQKINHVEASAKQASPISFGLSLDIPFGKQDFILTSLSFLKYSSMSSELGDKNLSLPLEKDFSSYYYSKFNQSTWSLFGGFHYASFSSYNIERLLIGVPLVVRDNNLFFGVFGVKKDLTKDMSVEFSFGQSLVVKAKDDDGHKVDSLKGQRYVFKLDHRLNGDWSYQFHLKHYRLKDPGSVESTYMGLGIGYELF
jgi:hypothetical protein